MLDKALKNNKLNKFVIIESLICLGIIYTNVTMQYSTTSTFFTMSFIVLLYEYIRHFLSGKRFELIDWLTILIVVISMVNILVNSVIKNVYIDFGRATNYFIFVSTIILFNLASNITLNKKTCNIVFCIQIIISLVYVYAYNYVEQTRGNTSMGLLTLNFSNPNFAGMFLLQSILFMSIGIMYFKNFLFKMLCVGLTVILFKYISETGARNVQIAYILFLVLSGLYIFKKDFKLPRWFSIVLNAAPIIFVPLYLGTIAFIEKAGWFNFLISEGKNLDSRVGMWNDYFYRIDNSWLIGNFAYARGNAHNALLVVVASYGVVVLALVILFNYLITHKTASKVANRFQGVSLAAFFAVIFMGFGEGALYAGGLGLYIFPALFIMLANVDI